MYRAFRINQVKFDIQKTYNKINQNRIMLKVLMIDIILLKL